MNTFEFTGVVFVIAALAGFLGSLTGLGGGVVVTPALTLLLGVDIRYAIGASLISVIATSSGAAAAYVREGYSNIRIGMLLEVATTLGAVAGAAVATRIPTSVLALIFGIILLYSAYASSRPRKPSDAVQTSDPLAEKLRLNGSFPTPEGIRHYFVQRVKAGFALMFGAGVIGGLLGIGSGAFKVIAMDQAMKIPFKVSTTTSNFMIGVTAAASAGVYLSRGYIDPGLAMPVMLGVLTGSLIGSRRLADANPIRRSRGPSRGSDDLWRPAGKTMSADHSHPEVRIEELLGTLLRIGVSIAALVVFVGAIVYLVRHGFEPRGYRTFTGEPEEFRTIRGVLKGLEGFHGRSIIQLGLLVLIATPVARVVFALVGFATLRDRAYVVICLIVLTVLMLSLFGSASVG